jgi:ATP-binding cassette subfamily B multidrug efflux pump
VARYRARYAAGAFCLAAATLASLAIPWTVQRAIDALRAETGAAGLGRYVAVIVALALANGLARLGSRFAIIGGGQRIEYDLRNDLYASLQGFPPAFYATHPTGELMSRASSDVAAVRALVGFGAVSLFGTAFAFVGALGAMLAVDPWLTLWAMAPYPALVFLVKRFNSVVNERAQAAQEQLGVLSAKVQEYIAGMSVVRAYTLEPRAAADFARENGEYLARSLALARTQSSVAPLMGLIAGVGTLVVLWAGGKAVVEGRLSLGALVAFNGYLAYLTWPTIALGWTLSILRRGLTSMQRIHEIVGAGSVGAEVAGAAAGSAAARAFGIRFEDLTFAYEGRAPALASVSFAVAPGETVAIVGPTGSGKSTLGLLLARLWEPPPGTTFVGDRDVTAIGRQELRAMVGYVPQEGFLFSRALGENVALGREGVDEARVRAATAAAGVAGEIEQFPAGYDTVVGERGLTLSGGQRQRVALARALAGAPPILVLDDAFASVDSAKEEEIVGSLRRFVSGRTVLLMTHRLRAAQLADRIVVLAEGRVLETGRHAELLAAGGLYARLWRIQQLEEEIARA